MVKAYISCPVSVSESHLQAIAIYVNKCRWEHRYWERGSGVYNEGKFIDTCDAFILVLPENKFQYNVELLSSGCRRELKRAMGARRKVFLAYSGMNGIHIYTTTINQMISGQVNTTGEFEKLGGELTKEQLKKVDSTLGNNPLLFSGMMSGRSSMSAGYMEQLTSTTNNGACNTLQGDKDQFTLCSSGTADYTKIVNPYANSFGSANVNMPLQGYNLSQAQADVTRLGVAVHVAMEKAIIFGTPIIITDRRAALL